MPNVSIDINGETIKPPIVPEGWYYVEVIKMPEIKEGKKSGKKYMEWILQILDGKFVGAPLQCNTTLEKGDNPQKSKRWLFHQAMAACGIKKNEEGKYEFATETLIGTKFYVRVVVATNSYVNFKGETIESDKNEIKEIAIMPRAAEDIPF